MDNSHMIGQTFATHKSGDCKIIHITHRKDIQVEFSDGFIAKCTLQNLLAGSVSNPYYPSVYNFGFIGEGEFKAKVNGKIFPYYDAWRGCIRRVYDFKFHQKRPMYIGCSVNPVWKNYQNFCIWSEDQVFEVGFKLDKDLMVYGNKEYGPETCVYLPNELNCIISDRWDTARGLPKGVSRTGNPKAKNKPYVASLQRKGRPNLNLGYFGTPEDASIVYKNTKEGYVKERAAHWKDRISERAFDALMTWTLPE